MIIEEGASVRRVEEMAKEIKSALERGEKPVVGKKKTASPSQSNDYAFFSKDLESYFPTPVKFIRNENGKGSITLKFSNDDELQSLVKLFEKLKENILNENYIEHTWHFANHHDRKGDDCFSVLDIYFPDRFSICSPKQNSGGNSFGGSTTRHFGKYSI